MAENKKRSFYDPMQRAYKIFRDICTVPMRKPYTRIIEQLLKA